LDINKLKIVFCMILFCNFPVHAGVCEAGEIPVFSSSEEFKERPGFIRGLIQEEKAIWSSPLRLTKKDAVIWGSVIAGTVYLITADEAIYREVKRYQRRSGWVDSVSPWITRLGDGKIDAGIAGLLFAGGSIFKNEKMRRTAALVLKSIIHTGIVVQVFKHLSGRQRPCVDDGRDRWYGPCGIFKRYQKGRNAYYSSFPSGHTIVVWGTASVIAGEYRRPIIIPLICYSLATFTGLSRITEDRHWASDVFFGAFLGYTIGRFLVKNDSKYCTITPIIESDRIGVACTINF